METIHFDCLKRRFCMYDNMYLYILILLYMLTALAYEIYQLKMTKA